MTGGREWRSATRRTDGQRVDDSRCTLKSTLGWKTLVTKRTCGGASGYAVVHTSLSSKRPPSYGVPGGPWSTAFQLKRLLSFSRLSTISESPLLRDSSLYSFISRLFCIRARSRAPTTAAAKAALVIFWILDPKMVEAARAVMRGVPAVRISASISGCTSSRIDTVDAQY